MNTHDLKSDVGYWINRLRMEVHQAFEARLTTYDVTMAQWCILLTLYNQKACTITELSKEIDVDKASMSRVVERLASKGLLTHSSGIDRRSGHIRLTLKGEDLVPRLIQEADLNEAQFFGHLTTEEKQQLQGLLRKIFKTTLSIHLEGWLAQKGHKS